MLEFLPEDVRKGLQAAQKRAARTSGRICVHVGDSVFPISKLGDTGFTVDLRRVPRLRGFVDIFDGPKHLSRALIIAASEDDGMMTYEFKRETPVLHTPIRDYVEDRASVSGYLAGPA